MGRYKTYPQQKKVFINPYEKDDLKKKKRFFRDIGHNIKIPDAAMNGTYIDKKCPFTGEINLKKRLHYNSKYKRYERRIKKVSVHLSPCFFGLVQPGDSVTVCETTRRISKTVHSVVVDFKKKQQDKEDQYKVIDN